MYTPTPIDTANVPIPEELNRLAELLAKNAHDVWARQRISEGWQYGVRRNDDKKETPCLVPYEELTESEKQYDREVSRQTLAVLLALGYRILPPKENSETR